MFLTLVATFTASLAGANPFFREYIFDKIFELRFDEKKSKDKKTKKQKIQYNYQQFMVKNPVVSGIGRVCSLEIKIGSWEENQGGNSGGGGSSVFYNCAIEGNNKLYFGHDYKALLPNNITPALFAQLQKKMAPDMKNLLTKLYSSRGNTYLFNNGLNPMPARSELMKLKTAMVQNGLVPEYYELNTNNDGTELQLKLNTSKIVSKYKLTTQKK